MKTSTRKFSATAWKAAAIRNMTRSRAATRTLLSKMSSADIRRPRTQGEWSVKDVLAHIVAWEEVAGRRLRLIGDGRGEQVVFYEEMADTDRFNSEAVRAARPMTVAGLLCRAERVRQALVESLKKLPDASLDDRSHRYAVIEWLPEFAWTHEQSHRQRIQKWLRDRHRSRTP